jgi:hypothetical protein
MKNCYSTADLEYLLSGKVLFSKATVPFLQMSIPRIGITCKISVRDLIKPIYITFWVLYLLLPNAAVSLQTFHAATARAITCGLQMWLADQKPTTCLWFVSFPISSATRRADWKWLGYLHKIFIYHNTLQNWITDILNTSQYLAKSSLYI